MSRSSAEEVSREGTQALELASLGLQPASTTGLQSDTGQVASLL